MGFLTGLFGKGGSDTPNGEAVKRSIETLWKLKGEWTCKSCRKTFHNNLFINNSVVETGLSLMAISKSCLVCGKDGNASVCSDCTGPLRDLTMHELAAFFGLKAEGVRYPHCDASVNLYKLA